MEEQEGYLFPIRLGLCCINTTLRKKDIFNSRTTIRRCFTVEKAKTLALQNIKDITPMVQWNHEHNIHVFRLSSDIFPHFTDTETESYTMDFADEALKEAGEMIRKYGQRITTHPGQYNQVGAKSRAIFEKTVQDLDAHAEMLERMGIPEHEGIINIHGGGVYGDIESTKRRWIEQFDDLPRRVKNRLTIENCEKCYCVRDCIDIAEEVKIPVIFDSHHYECYDILHPDVEQEEPWALLDEIVEMWRRRGCNEIVTHVSSQREGAKVGAHSDYIEKIPDYFLEIGERHGMGVDLEIEAKCKEKSIFDLYEKYPKLE